MTHRTTIDIKQGKITREEAMEMIRKYDGYRPKSLQLFCEYLGITEGEFDQIALKHVIPPFEPIDPTTLPEGKKLWDQELWFRDNQSMGRNR